MSNNHIELVEIIPIEYHKRRGKNRNPRIIRYRGLSFSPNLNQRILNKIIEKTKMKRKASSQQNPDRFLYYQYSGRPQLILDLVANTINVSIGTLKEYGLRHCQQQASILMRLLKKHGYAYFKRVSVTVDPYRLGRTLEDLEITFEAIRNLLYGEK